MNKKGFTLVELLAVIVILGLIIALTVPAIIHTRKNMSDALTKQEKRNVEEAGRLLGLDLDDTGSEIFGCKGWIKDEQVMDGEVLCNTTDWSWYSGKSIKVNIAKLKKHEYFKDDQSRCKGNVIIIKEDNGYSVDSSDVICE